jgi:hypothetical protein
MYTPTYVRTGIPSFPSNGVIYIYIYIYIYIHHTYVHTRAARRRELEGALTAGEKAVLSMRDQMIKLWAHPSFSDEAAERANISRISKHACMSVP